MRFEENILYDTNSNPQIKTFHSSVAPGKRIYREHHHTQCELSFFLSGCGTYKVGKKTYEFSKNDIFLFSSDETHCITEIYPDQPLNSLTIYFEPRIFWSKSEVSDMSLLKIFFARNINFENRIDRDNASTKQIGNLILQLENEIKNKPEHFELMARMILNKILITLIRDYNYVSGDYSVNTNYISQLNKAMTYIDNNLDSDITLDNLSKTVSFSPAYFSTIFKKFNGISPWDYITIKRVEKAVNLLKSTQMTKLDIAMSCGFKSSSNFYKAFSKVTGKKPSQIVREINLH